MNIMKDGVEITNLQINKHFAYFNVTENKFIAALQ